MEDAKVQVGDYYVITNLENDIDEKIFITEVNYVNNEIKCRNENFIEEEYSDKLSNISNIFFYRKYNIIDIKVFNSFLLAKLTPDAYIILSDSIIIKTNPKIDEFLIDKKSRFFNQFIAEINLNSSQIILEMPHFFLGKAIVNGKVFNGYIEV